MRTGAPACFVLLSFLASGRVLAGPILYEQPEIFPDICPCWTTDRSPTEGGYQTFDNFILAADGAVAIVTWVGFSTDVDNLLNNPAALDITSWNFSFWSDGTFGPTTRLYSQDLPAGSVHSQFLGTSTVPLGPPLPADVYRFRAVLPAPFLAQGGTPYWFSVLGTSGTINPIFLWANASAGDYLTLQDSYNSSDVFEDRYGLPGDRAFTLEGVPEGVPEPSTLALVGLGLLALYARRRRAQSSEFPG